MLARPQIRSSWAALLVALFLASAGNVRLWSAVTSGPARLSAPGLLAGFLVLLALFTVLLQLLALPWIFKPIAVIGLLASSIASFAMLGYGVLIDASMIRNLVQTDAAEAGELLTPRGLACVLVLGLLPAALLLWTEIRYRPVVPELKRRGLVLALSVGAALCAGIPAWQELSFTVREHHELKLMVNPSSPIGAVVSYVHGELHQVDAGIAPIALDATRPARPAGTPRLIFVLVLGETARADHFSLNGYARDTNPELSAREVINFPDVTACGTSTAEVLPRLFSGLSREDGAWGAVSKRENLLDVLQRVGVAVLWRENNSGCKGVCDRVPSEQVTGPPGSARDDEVYDERLLVGLQDELDRQAGDVFIVLHQRGSHGPAYSQRSPPAFKRFLPECAAEDLQLCPQELLINAYDNTIVYTDHVLGLLIDQLAANGATSRVAMLYVSDHGESLGENGVYLHGFPDWLAPEAQTHVPMVFWASPGFYAQRGLPAAELEARSGRAYAHDCVFHTVLGAFGVRTEAYDASLDLFSGATSEPAAPVRRNSSRPMPAKLRPLSGNSR